MQNSSRFCCEKKLEISFYNKSQCGFPANEKQVIRTGSRGSNIWGKCWSGRLSTESLISRAHRRVEGEMERTWPHGSPPTSPTGPVALTIIINSLEDRSKWEIREPLQSVGLYFSCTSGAQLRWLTILHSQIIVLAGCKKTRKRETDDKGSYIPFNPYKLSFPPHRLPSFFNSKAKQRGLPPYPPD